ncbi:MAG: RagB/SusD family nutrient uptake outer membrane protein, partial [Runella slithyformis]
TAYIGQEFMSDNTTLDFNPLDRGGAAGWEAFEFSTVNPGNGEIAALWNNHYATMYNINYALEKLAPSTIDAATKSAIEGQLKFIRAYHYFNLVRYFGDVVLVTKTLSNPNEAFDLVKSPEADVYKQIEADLKEAVNLLPATYPAVGRGRATKGAALSLLGKVYLTLKRYPEAVTTLKQVLPLGYSLYANYKDNFDPARKNGSESVFEVQYRDSQLGWGPSRNGHYMPQQLAPRGIGEEYAPYGGWGNQIPTEQIVKAFEPGDKRRQAQILVEGDSAYFGFKMEKKWTTTGFAYTKWWQGPDKNDHSKINLKQLRFSEVLLNYAEILNESGRTGDAYTHINRVRARAG